MPNHATPDHPIHKLLAARWSPYVISTRAVKSEDVRCLFEAARWAASSYNEQPWRYMLATRENREEYERLLSCLVEPNQAWARNAPVLALGIASTEFQRNQQPNRVAFHDLGLASANLTFEATARGLVVHQMAGILPDRARDLYGIPPSFEALTALAIGYTDESSDADPALRKRDAAPRTRNSLSAFVFEGSWTHPSAIVVPK